LVRSPATAISARIFLAKKLRRVERLMDIAHKMKEPH
jgi:hypothetical protein